MSDAPESPEIRLRDGTGFPQAEPTTLTPVENQWQQTGRSEIQRIRGDWLAVVYWKDDQWEWSVRGFRFQHPVYPGGGSAAEVEPGVEAAEKALERLDHGPRQVSWRRSEGMMIGSRYRAPKADESQPEVGVD